MPENKAKSYGGAIYMKRGKLEIDKSEFSENSAEEGGAIYIKEDATCNITNSVFQSNSATNGSCFLLEGDSLYYTGDTEFNDNLASFGSIGYIKGDSGQKLVIVKCNSTSSNGVIYEEYSGYNEINIIDSVGIEIGQVEEESAPPSVTEEDDENESRTYVYDDRDSGIVKSEYNSILCIGVTILCLFLAVV